MFPILSEARIIAHRIFLGIGGIYLFSAILLMSPLAPGIRNLLSYLHVFSFFPTLLFLGINVTLLFFTMKDVKTVDSPIVPTKNIIMGSVVGLLSLSIIVWLLFL